MKKTAEQILVKSEKHYKESTKVLRRALIEIGIPHKCSKCGLQDEWNGEPIVIQIDHINGDSDDNTANNLRFLCPNCHSQTETYGTRNLPVKPLNKCPHCEKTLDRRSVMCRKCRRDKKSIPIDYEPESLIECSCGNKMSKWSDRCRKCYAKSKQKTDRPSHEELSKLVTTKSILQISRDFGVADNTIRKWCEGYGIPYKLKDRMLPHRIVK